VSSTCPGCGSKLGLLGKCANVECPSRHKTKRTKTFSENHGFDSPYRRTKRKERKKKEK
jgi:hypothetical protein